VASVSGVTLGFPLARQGRRNGKRCRSGKGCGRAAAGLFAFRDGSAQVSGRSRPSVSSVACLGAAWIDLRRTRSFPKGRDAR
jgi:hypothetical protein